jgi:DeoR/GlpR family transcriptional regulator of sugar metabolism
MMVQERRRRVLELVKSNGFIALTDIAVALQASESTVRRDLDFWDQQGQLKRTHGGAMTVVSDNQVPGVLPGLEERATTAVAEKRAIARTANARIPDGASVLLDGGTTTLELARLLVNRPIQVVTNSLPIVALLSQSRVPDVILLGGVVYPRTGVALGPSTIEQLKNIHVSQAILSCHGITQKGLFNHNLLLVETQRAMLKSAEEKVILADHTKSGRHALTLLCPLSDIDTLIVDEGVTQEARQWLEETGVQLVVSPK